MPARHYTLDFSPCNITTMKNIKIILVLLILSSNSCEQSSPQRTEQSANTPPAPVVTTPPEYIGRQSCGSCHAGEVDLYTGSDHDLAMQHANEETILGNFEKSSFNYNGIISTFFKKENRFYVNTDGPDGVMTDFEIKYTFGVVPLQQYLIELPGGRLQALSIAWNSLPKNEGGQEWFHLYPDEKIDHHDELHWTGKNFNWNYMCAECHSTNLSKNFDLETNSYKTSWSEIDVSCESCHGPASNHLKLAETMSEDSFRQVANFGLVLNYKDAIKGQWLMPSSGSIAVLNEQRETDQLIENCGRCHSRRTTIDSPHNLTRRLHDTHRVALLESGLYFADGQINDEVYVYGSFIQSKMYHAGVSCSDCHDPHSLKLRAEGNGLCLQCHKSETYNTETHHFHEINTRAAECVSCHMTSKNYMVVDPRHDHSFRIPRPDLSIDTGSPNACNQCHADRSAEWALASINQRYNKDSSGFHYAHAMDAADQGKADASEMLLRVVSDSDQAAIIRASAMSRLVNYLNPQTIQSVLSALYDEDPLVRTAALNVIKNMNPDDRFQLVGRLLNDPVKSVRISAATLLAPLNNTGLAPKAQQQLSIALGEYIDAQRENEDRAFAHTNLGNLYMEMQRHGESETSYKQAIKLEPDYIPAYTNLAELYRLQNKEQQGEGLLREALGINDDIGVLHHALGLSLVRQKRYEEALDSLEQASKRSSDNTQFSLVYAIALNSQGRTEDAINELSRSREIHPNNGQLIMTQATMYRDSGQIDSAIKVTKELLAISPNNPQAIGLQQQLRELNNRD